MDVAAFIAKYQEPGFDASAEAASLLTDAFYRDRLLREIGKKLEAGHRPLLLRILDLEAKWRLMPRGVNDEADLFENIYYCALLLFRVGDVRDSLAIWQVKMTHTDIGCGMDGEFMVGGGRAATIAYLRSLEGDADAAEAADYLSGKPAYSDIGEWLEFRSGYFTYMLE